MGNIGFNTVTVLLQVLRQLKFGRNVSQIRICCCLLSFLRELKMGMGCTKIPCVTIDLLLCFGTSAAHKTDLVSKFALCEPYQSVQAFKTGDR